MDVAKRKITVKVTYNAPSSSSRPPSRTSSPRPPSPSKQPKSPTEASTSFRPKAKVNSVATIRRSPSVVSGTAPGTQRAASPTKLSRAQNGTLTPTFQPRVATVTTATTKVTVRPQTPVSAPNTPEVRSKTLSPGSEVGRNTSPRVWGGSSLHHAMSFSSLQTASHDRNEQR
ncbi:hypothetical protein FA13DRAFT_408668 [Coprinellus micaceus]|uniref:Uncharacterized protein n=1 Tax=Coprinellus micaceus TaxID=71717 RepID=A0A4Y7TXB5_COPMI|nr:hypothetical protein FA13DRAFT_408668 [Coprinellus micaceus]